MNMPKLISFDLQGTLSDSAFSDEFWLELLPELYATKHNIELAKAKHILEKNYQSVGKYHELFYNHRLRLDALLPQWQFQAVVDKLVNKPKLDIDLINIIKKIPRSIAIIVFSATTRDFIDIELGKAKKYFTRIYSAIDDFHTAGKPPSLFEKIANQMNVEKTNCLHIGDCQEMDYQNAKIAGWHSYHWNKNYSRTGALLELQFTMKNFLS